MNEGFEFRSLCIVTLIQFLLMNLILEINIALGLVKTEVTSTLFPVLGCCYNIQSLFCAYEMF